MKDGGLLIEIRIVEEFSTQIKGRECVLSLLGAKGLE